MDLKQIVIYLDNGKEFSTTITADEVEGMLDHITNDKDELESIQLNDTTIVHINIRKIDAIVVADLDSV